MCSPADQERLSEALADFFHCCGIAFNIVEHPKCIAMLRAFRPGFVPPSRRDMGGKLLTEANGRTIEENKNRLAGHSEAVLHIDGWKNSASNSKMVATLIQAPGGVTVFLKAWDITALSETGELLSQIVDDSVALAKTIYNIDLKAVISDSASNMLLMGKTVSLPHVRCNAHIANLLMKDVGKLDDRNDTLRDVVKVLKVFSKANLALQIIERGGTKPSLPGDTRWCGNRDALLSYQKNLGIFKAIVAGESVDQTISHLLFNDVFNAKVNELIMDLDPIAATLNELQKTETTLATAVELWKDLEEKCSWNIADTLQYRFKKSLIFNDIALVANIVDPRYKGRKLSNTEKARAMEILMAQMGTAALNSLVLYMDGKGYFHTMNTKKLPPQTYWSLAKFAHSELYEIVIKYLIIPSSTAPLERVFSNWGLVHNNVRNRLGNAKSEMLVNIYYSNRIKSDKKLIDYEEVQTDCSQLNEMDWLLFNL